MVTNIKMASEKKLNRGRRRASGNVGGETIVVEAAWLYYHEGLNQSVIAERLGVSRATVVNYLQEARTKGYVKTALADSVFTEHHRALELSKRFGLQASYVVYDGRDDDETLKRVARGAAEWLPQLLAPSDKLGVAWGQTIYKVAEACETNRAFDLEVIQLVGSMLTPYGFSSDSCSTILADRLSAKCVNLHTPAILTSDALAENLRNEPIIKSQLDRIATCNKAIFAAGSCDIDSHIVSSGIATLDDLAAYRNAGAVGVICGRFVDCDGRPVAGDLNNRIMGVELENLKGLDLGLLVSIGKEKVKPMLAAIRGGYVTHLVTSLSTAEIMLASTEEGSGDPGVFGEE